MHAVRRCSWIASLLIAAFTLPLLAQNPPAPPTSQPAFGGFDPAALRDRIVSGVKASLECTDDEWKLLEPKLIKIFLLRLDVSGRGGMVVRGARGSAFMRALLDPNALPSQVEEKTAALQQLIDSNETSNAAYTNALAQLRKAREKAKADLETAQKNLTELLTVRQEAALVQLGLLE
ncbi:MAG: hypothetical protein FWD61_10265 [Phycisphaerales bacterium]|nr:hypothetical protein [Phycisphaerales bacterium]